MANINLTLLLDSEMKQLAAVKNDAKDVRERLKELRSTSDWTSRWLVLTGANGREIHMTSDMWIRITVINEVIVVEEQGPSKEIAIARAQPVDPFARN